VYMPASTHACQFAAHLTSKACLLLRCDDGTVRGSTLAFPVVPWCFGCFDAVGCLDEVERIGFVGWVWRCPIGGTLKPALYVHVCRCSTQHVRA